MIIFLFCLLTTFPIFSCNSENFHNVVHIKEAELSAEQEKEHDAGSHEGKEDDDESILLPVNVHGSYFRISCQVLRLASWSYPASVGCALVNREGQKAVVDSNNQADWRIDLSRVEESLNVSTILLSNDSSWHVEFDIAGDPVIVNRSLSALKFEALLNGSSHSSNGIINNFTWVKANGGPIPHNAVHAGSEQGGTVFSRLCKLHINDAILPGKLIPHYKDNSKSVCYTVYDGVGIRDVNDDFQRKYQSEILIDSKQNSYSWVESGSSSNVQALAIIAGQIGDLPVHLCRSLERGVPPDPELRPNDLIGEYTPGYIHPQDGLCHYEFHGAKISETYEIMIHRRNNY